MKIIVYDQTTGAIHSVRGATGVLFNPDGTQRRITTIADVLEQAFGAEPPANLAAIEVAEDYAIPDGKMIQSGKVVDDPAYVAPKPEKWDGTERRKENG